MLRKSTTFSLGLIAAFLAGCGGGAASVPGSGSSNSTGGGRTQIYAYSVTGSDNKTSTGSQSVTINPSQNGGAFTLYWDASSSTQPYVAQWYVSTDNALSDDDVELLSRNCDQASGDCQQQYDTFNCTLDNSMDANCSDASSSSGTNLTNYFSKSGLPVNDYLLLRVCDGLFQDCVVKAIPTTFQ